MAWAPDYATVDQLRAYESVSDTADDAELTFAIAAASRAVDRFTNRQFGLVAAPEDRYYTAHRDRTRRRWIVEIDDLMTVDGLAVSYDTAEDGTYSAFIEEYALRPVNAAPNGRPWTEILLQSAGDSDAGVEVRARFGWTAIPQPIVQATLLQASRIFNRKNAPFGVAGSPDAGSEMRLLARIDPDVEVVLAPYRRWWGAA